MSSRRTVLVVTHETVLHPIQEAAARLSALGCHAVIQTSIDFNVGAPVSPEAEVILLSNAARADRASLDRFSQLKAVVYIASGTEAIDLEAMTERGIYVGFSPTPEAAESLAEATIMLILASLYNLKQSERILRDDLPRPRGSYARMLKNRTLGLVGFGRIAQQVAMRLDNWGVKILVHARHPANMSNLNVNFVPFQQLLRDSDIISVHASLTDASRNLISADALKLVKPGAILINTARGRIVDEAAVHAALTDGTLESVALDTFVEEPLPPSSRLRHLDHAILTPHIVGHTIEAQESVIAAAVENVLRVLDGRAPRYCKNTASIRDNGSFMASGESREAVPQTHHPLRISPPKEYRGSTLDQITTTPRLSNSDSKMWRMSSSEMDRRWNLVRKHLTDRKLDALIVQGYEDKVGGAVKWLTDVPAGYPRTIIFHANDLMTVIDHGAAGETRRLDGKDINSPGVGELITNWGHSSVHYTAHLAAADVIRVIQQRGYRKIAWANPNAMPFGFVAGVKEGLSNVEFLDETEFVDSAKAAKSDEELILIRRTAASQDAIFTKLLDHIEPGMRDFEVNAFIEHELQLLGTERGTYIGRSAIIGKPSIYAYRHFQGRTINQGDHISVLLESNGLGGYWTELGRTICFGQPSGELQDAFDLCVQAQEYTAGLCRPGKSPPEIFDAFNVFMTAHGAAADKRIFAHSQGHDMVERPLIRSDETMRITTSHCLAIHPAHVTASFAGTVCDNFIVGADKTECIHSTPKQIFVL